MDYSLKMNDNITRHSPIIISKFQSLDEQKLFHHKYELRHPGAIFNITSEFIVASLSQFIDVASQKIFESDSLYNGYRLVLYDFFKFYDSCFEIMACFCNAKNKWKLYIDQWLDKNGFLACQNFKKNLNDDINVLKLEYNKLKHTSNRINWLNQYVENSTCFGYYLEKSGANGKSEPQNMIDYPISLNRQVRHIFYCIYKISNELSTQLDVVTRNLKLNFEPVNKPIETEPRWRSLFEKIELLPQVFLLKEINKEFYRPIVNMGKMEFVKDVVKPDNFVSENFKAIRTEVTTTGDGYTKTFTIPN